MEEMCWYVYRDNWEKKKITKYNIFDHYSFNKDVCDDLKKCDKIESFADRLKSNLMYYYWSKCEWEIILSPWVGAKDGSEVKIDVYDQVMLNWDKFLNYVWSFKSDL